MPELPDFHRNLRRLDGRASSAFHSNSPDFLQDAAGCADELFTAAHISLASALALVTALYGDPWTYDLRRFVWPYALENLKLIRDGQIFAT